MAFTLDISCVAVIGLGYVGLPLAVAFGRHVATIGYDSSAQKIESLKKRSDPTGEVSKEDFESASKLIVTLNPEEISGADAVIVAVPTPIDESRKPDLGPLQTASQTVGSHMKKGALVVYESTVYPGATEEVCVPILENASGMKWKKDGAHCVLKLRCMYLSGRWNEVKASINIKNAA